jgi:hypothetical protein
MSSPSPDPDALLRSRRYAGPLVLAAILGAPWWWTLPLFALAGVLFLGAAGGIALSHLPGLPMVAGVAMGIGAMSVMMLRLPLTSVLLATLLLAADGLTTSPAPTSPSVAAEPVRVPRTAVQ